MMTAAGTMPAAKVLVIGAGVAGLQAIATAKRLAFTLGEVMTKLNGDLETLLKKQQVQEEVVQVTMDGGGNWK